MIVDAWLGGVGKVELTYVSVPRVGGTGVVVEALPSEEESLQSSDLKVLGFVGMGEKWSVYIAGEEIDLVQYNLFQSGYPVTLGRNPSPSFPPTSIKSTKRNY